MYLLSDNLCLGTGKLLCVTATIKNKLCNVIAAPGNDMMIVPTCQVSNRRQCKLFLEVIGSKQ